MVSNRSQVAGSGFLVQSEQETDEWNDVVLDESLDIGNIGNILNLDPMDVLQWVLPGIGGCPTCWH